MNWTVYHRYVTYFFSLFCIDLENPPGMPSQKLGLWQNSMEYSPVLYLFIFNSHNSKLFHMHAIRMKSEFICTISSIRIIPSNFYARMAISCSIHTAKVFPSAFISASMLDFLSTPWVLQPKYSIQIFNRTMIRSLIKTSH